MPKNSAAGGVVSDRAEFLGIQLQFSSGILGRSAKLLQLALDEGATVEKKTRRDYLRRLPPELYRGQAYVHWSLTMDDRKTGWLTPAFYADFREILTHASFRFGFCCPIYCCMPDHIHLLWAGILDDCDQRTAMKYFRRHLNPVLETLAARFQRQPYDHVLRETERERSAFENVVEYIARNPERRDLVPPDGFASYSFTGCLVPGYPELRPFEDDYWERFWRIYSHLRKRPAFARSHRRRFVAEFPRIQPRVGQRSG